MVYAWMDLRIGTHRTFTSSELKMLVVVMLTTSQMQIKEEIKCSCQTECTKRTTVT
jgi:hypothetical protein